MKYSNGYLPKVVYHFKNGNIDRAKSFMDSHYERYGAPTSEQIDWLNEQLKNDD
jgi:hypothetical protein